VAVGYNKISWDGCDGDGDFPANGVYLYKLQASNEENTIEEISKVFIMR